jgi:DNA-binding NarL/FixJ family response regulator
MRNGDWGIAEEYISLVVGDESTFERLRTFHFSLRSKDFRVVRGFGDLDAMLASSRQFEPCLLVLDSLHLLKATPAQRSELLLRPQLRCVARVSNKEIPNLTEIMMSGCFGFFTENTTPPQLERIFSSIASGEMWFPRRLLTQNFQALLLKQISSGLSRRESEILALLGQQLSNKNIAGQLFISQETLRWHLRKLYAKTRVRGREQLVKYASEFNHDASAESADQDAWIPQAAVWDTRRS